MRRRVVVEKGDDEGTTSESDPLEHDAMANALCYVLATMEEEAGDDAQPSQQSAETSTLTSDLCCAVNRC
jgi:hypothetical protein